MKLSDWMSATETRAKDLAVMAGTTEATISRLRKGSQRPSMALMQRIFDVTEGQVTPNDFMDPKPCEAAQ